VQRAAEYRAAGQCLQALHLLEMALAAEPGLATALQEQATCLELMLEDAQVLNNSYEVMWLEAEIDKTRAALDG